MKSAPAVDVLADEPAWRVIVGSLAGLAVTVQLAWFTSTRSVAVLILFLLTAGIAAWQLAGLRRQAGSKRMAWNGRQWSLCRSSSASTYSASSHVRDPVCGQLDVLMDIGSWVLIRFVPVGSQPQGKSRPLPMVLSRRHSNGQWHAVRCALYAPRPEAATHARTPHDLA